MSRNDDRYKQHLDGAMAIAHPDTIERDRRCQNCMSFNNGDMAIQHYKMCQHQDLEARARSILERDGVLPPGAPTPKRIGDDDPHQAMAKLGVSYDYGDQLLRQGMMGICLKHATDAEFVHAHYLCAKWTQKYKPDGASDGHVDETSEAARARLGRDDK